MQIIIHTCKCYPILAVLWGSIPHDAMRPDLTSAAHLCRLDRPFLQWSMKNPAGTLENIQPLDGRLLANNYLKIL